MAHDVSDAAQTGPAGADARPDGVVDTPDVATVIGEPAVAERGVGGLVAGGDGAGTAPRSSPAPQPAAVAPPARRRRGDPHATRRPAVGLTALVLTALAGAFFGWVSAEPFWLATGRGVAGTVTVTSCQPSGLDERCVGRFAAEDFTVDAVRLSSVPSASRERGDRFEARMLDGGSRWAYAGPVSGLHLRWQLGLAAVLVCGVLIGLATGVGRLRTAGRGGRFVLWAVSLAGPLALFAGMLVAALL